MSMVIDEQESIKENEPINVLNDLTKTTKLTDFDKIAIPEAIKNCPCQINAHFVKTDTHKTLCLWFHRATTSNWAI